MNDNESNKAKVKLALMLAPLAAGKVIIVLLRKLVAVTVVTLFAAFVGLVVSSVLALAHITLPVSLPVVGALTAFITHVHKESK